MKWENLNKLQHWYWTIFIYLQTYLLVEYIASTKSPQAVAIVALMSASFWCLFVYFNFCVTGSTQASNSRRHSLELDFVTTLNLWSFSLSSFRLDICKTFGCCSTIIWYSKINFRHKPVRSIELDLLREHIYLLKRTKP